MITHDATTATKKGVAKRRHRKPDRIPVVVLIYPDRFIEVYGPKWADVVTVNVPVLPDAEAEEFIESNLPPNHRKIFAPGLCRAVENIETILPSDMMRRQLIGDLFNALKEVTS